jgi:hypothetical protein
MTQVIKVNLQKKEMIAFGRTIPISCDVRNELNGRRYKNEVVLSIPHKKPVYPRTFPLGTWNVYRPAPRQSDYLRPFFIPTDAWQDLPIWKLDAKGQYLEPMKYTTKDEGYGLHFSTSSTTQGCIKITKLDDLLFLVDRINYELNSERRVIITVS